jgi:hypothetical protein
VSHNNIGDMPANMDVSQMFVDRGFLDLPKVAPPAIQPDLDRVRIYCVDSNSVASLVYQSDSGFTARILRDQLFIAYNGSGATLAKGSVVASGGVFNNVVSLVKARADTEQGQAIGFAAQDIPNGSYGRVMIAGRLDGVNTAAFVAPLPVWLSATTAGTYVGTPPPLPGRVQQVGSIIVPGSTSAGAIRVDVRNTLNVGLPGGLAYLDSASRLTAGQIGDLASGVYGDGSDGDITVSAGTSTIARDMYYRNLTINTGATLKTNGYRVYVQNTLTNLGTVDRSGNDASGRTAGTALAAGSLGGSAAGGAGGSLLANGTAGGAITALVGTVGTAGTGGATTRTAGAAGAVTAFAASYGGIRALPWAAMGVYLGVGGNGVLGGAPGGGGGAGTSTQGGGGGGGGGGAMILCARKLINSGTITTAGGNGGSATGTSAGAGGGGGGGPLVLVYGALTNTGTITAGAGASGVTGIDGTVPANAGPVIQIPN